MSSLYYAGPIVLRLERQYGVYTCPYKLQPSPPVKVCVCVHWKFGIYVLIQNCFLMGKTTLESAYWLIKYCGESSPSNKTKQKVEISPTPRSIITSYLFDDMTFDFINFIEHYNRYFFEYKYYFVPRTCTSNLIPIQILRFRAIDKSFNWRHPNWNTQQTSTNINHIDMQNPEVSKCVSVRTD